MFGVSSQNTGGETKDFRWDGSAVAKAMRTKPPKGSGMTVEESEDHMVSSFAPASIDCEDSSAVLKKTATATPDFSRMAAKHGGNMCYVK
jgi:hypothetical protein